jgi:hypothetical protein
VTILSLFLLPSLTGGIIFSLVGRRDEMKTWREPARYSWESDEAYAEKVEACRVHWSTKAAEALEAASTKAGVSLEEIEVRYASIDRTWGDKVGLVVYGGTEELRARCAAFLSAWMRKNLDRKGSYEEQRTSHEIQPVGWLLQESAGRTGADAVFPIEPPSYQSEEQKAEYRKNLRPALAIPAFYYPCAE